ncbi:MAG: ELM1/GtrOC1 family putative glycosyltransferase [Candidatus Omnitrophica bacterium]|nr:ELM1/GtrOC1 family putative glycosyltransferase [Candidatus Omnitrophota bacterium]
MKKDFVLDYAAYTLLKLLGPLIRLLPLCVALFFGRRLGDLLYCFDAKHRAISYANLRTAFSAEMSPLELKRVTRDFYRTFGQNLIEVFIIPRLDKKYIDTYITIDNFHYIGEAFKKGKGVILLGVHEGSWELSNIICSNLGFPFSLFVRGQRLARLNGLLNHYRSQKGCVIIEKRNQTRQLIEELGRNHAIGMTLDQGGKSGMLVDFFGKQASMSTGALRLSLRYGAVIIPAFYVRIKGSYTRIILEPPFELQKTQDPRQDLLANLQRLVAIFEKNIRRYPREYLWSYRIWKYGNEKKILIVSDAKTGHLRQAEGLASVTEEYLKEKGISASTKTVTVTFKSRFAALRCIAGAWLCGRHSCQGKLEGLKGALDENAYRSIIAEKPDIVISCGSSVAPLALIIARENLSTAMVVMRPSLVPASSFDLCVVPRHDKPVSCKNAAVTTGALNLMTPQYLESARASLSLRAQDGGKPALGLLIGGDTRGFVFSEQDCAALVRQVKGFLESADAEILVTTSRRTSPAVEKKIREEFSGYPRCKLLVIANEKLIPDSAGAILAASTFVVVTPESISMLSEAATSGRHVVTFSSPGLGRKHELFLKNMREAGFIHIAELPGISRELGRLWKERPAVRALDDRARVREALQKIL